MRFFKRKLKNGIVVLLEKRELPIASVSISNFFGGSYEKLNVKGIAHFIEHLVFTGTKTRTHEDISREIEKKGGILNAFTMNELTCFYFKLPSQHVFSGLDILTDILKNPIFDRKKFEKEKKVILEEIKMYKDDPQKHVFELIERALFENPMGEGIIGNEETIKNLDRDFVHDYFKKAYRGNFLVSIVGNVDFEKICKYFEENFEDGKCQIKQEKIIKKNEVIIEKRKGIDQANFLLGMHAPLLGSEEYVVLDVLDSYLADGMSSQLFLKIREERGLAYAVKSSIVSEKNYSYYIIYAGTMKEAVEDVKKLIIQGFKDINNMSEEDLKEAKERVIGLREIRSENSSNVMQELILHEMAEKAEGYYEYVDKVKRVKLEDVKKLAKDLINKYSVAIVMPE